MHLAVFSDIHGNRQAFEACLKVARARGAERFVLLGDLVGYGADPEWVVDTAMELVAQGAIAVRGNHDDAVGTTTEAMNADAQIAIEWTRRPTYCVVPQSAPNKLNTAVIHWVDLYCGPITFQLRDQLGLKSTLALLSRTHKTAVAVFLDGPQHTDDPTRDDYLWPQ